VDEQKSVGLVNFDAAFDNASSAAILEHTFELT